MNVFVSYYLLHLVTAWAVFLYMSVVGFTVGLISGFLPIGKFAFIVGVQILGFIPFRYLYGKLASVHTNHLRYQFNAGACIGSYVLVHFWSILFTFSVLQGYLVLRSAGLDQMLDEQLMLLYEGSEVDFSVYGWVFEFLTENLVKFPSYILKYLQNLPLKVLAYCLLLFSMTIGLEHGREKNLK